MSEGYIIKIGNKMFLADDMTINEEDILPVSDKLEEAFVFPESYIGAKQAWTNRDLIWDYQDKGHGLFGHEVSIEKFKDLKVAHQLETNDNI